MAAQAQRLDPEERRALLVAAARETFADQGYTQTGLADIAVRAGVSKTLLYHYFSDGRPELYREVIQHLVDEVAQVIAEAVAAPAPAAERLTELVISLISYFEHHPDAYRLLLLEPWGSGDPGVIGQASAARARLAGELNRLLAPAGQPLSTTLAGGAAVLGAVLHVCDLWMTDQISREQAADVAHRFVEGGLEAVDLL